MFSNPKQFARMLTELGITIPKNAAAELATLEALAEAKQINYVQTATNNAAAGKLTAKTAVDVLNGLADDMVRAERFEDAARYLEAPIVARWYAALRESEAALTDGIVAAAAESIAIVQEAGRHFGTTARPADVLDAGVAAVEVWEKLTGALDRLALVRNVRVQLADLWGHGEQSVTWWIAGATDAPDLERAHLIYTQAGNCFHNLAEAGYQLRINTPAQIKAVERGARVETEKQLAAESEARAAVLKEADAIRRAN